MKKTFAIGDVHGQFSTLKKLLDQLPINWQTDELVFLGDLVDRGLESRQVIEFLMQLQKDFSTVTVLSGNHEEMMVNSYTDEEEFSHWLLMGGDTTYLSYVQGVVHWKKFIKELSYTTYNYLKNLPINYQNEHAIFVHAGAMQNSKRQWIVDNPLIARWHRGKDFFRNYQGKTIVVGHTPTNKIRLMLGEAEMPPNRMTAWSRNNIIAIDCGAGHNGQLCAVELPSGNLYYQPVI